MDLTKCILAFLFAVSFHVGIFAQCLPTGSDIEGPYYVPNAPQTDSIIAPVLQSNAQKIWVRGTVYFNGCKVPIPNPVLDIWHTNEDGDYSNVDGNPDDFAYRAKVQGSADGSYRYYSVLPGLYPGRPRHTHFKVWVNDTLKLTSQMYFAGDSLNAGDPWASNAEPNRIVQLDTLPNGDLEAHFDIYTIDSPWTNTLNAHDQTWGALTVYPNPMTEDRVLYLPEVLSITMTDMVGKVWLRQDHVNRLELNGCPPGVYQLIASDGRAARIVVPSR